MADKKIRDIEGAIEGDTIFENGKWYQATDVGDGLFWLEIPITDVWKELLLIIWEKLVQELSCKTRELYQHKEAYLIAEREIVETTNFKELYGANNQKVRDQHVKGELEDMVSEIKELEWDIEFIKNYIPLIREVIRTKKELLE